MKRLIFTKANNSLLQSPNSNIVYLTFDENGVATSIDNTGNRSSIGSVINMNRQTASYQLQLSDAGKIIEMNVGATNSITVPSNATASFTTGTQILITQYGSGQTGVTYSAPVVIRSSGSRLKLTNQYSAATLVKIGTDEWYLFGDITT